MNELTTLEQVFAVHMLLKLVFTAIGFAIFVYAMRTDERAPATGRRLIAAVLFSVFLAGPFIATAHADDENDFVIITTKCSSLTIWDLEYWMLECWLYGGGGR